MIDTINLALARKKLPELADRASAGRVYVVSRRGRELAVLIGIDEYRRLKALEEAERQGDFDALLASPAANAMTEEEARRLAVQLVWEERSRYSLHKK